MSVPTEQMQEIALELLKLGYVPLRIDANSKAAKSSGWQTDTPTEESLIRAFSRTSNMGVRMGDMHKDGTCLLAIDIDLENAELIRCVECAIGVKVPTKQGKKGSTYIVRMDRETKTHKIKWIRDKKKIDAIDVLCRGAQTVIPPSTHPDTKLPYKWIAGEPLWEIDYRSLPVFGEALLDEIRGFCKNPDDPIYALNDMEWRGEGGGGNTHDTCLAAVASMVARKWTDADIHDRIVRAKQEACESAGSPYNWPEAEKRIQEWIDSSREKEFDKKTKARIEDVPVEVINRYVYVAGIDRMFDTKKGVTLNKHVFDNMLARDIPRPWATALTHPDFRTVDRLTYAPGQPLLCREKNYDSEAVLDCLNVYSHSGIDPEEGDAGPWVQLVKDVMDGQEEAYRHVFRFLAFAVQNPGERINHALVIQGEQGIGKDSIFAAVEKVLGSQNCGQVTLQHVESAFNEWLFGKQLIMFQEMWASGRRNIYNKLKTYITDPVHVINAKNISLQRIANRAVYVFLTNYRHALSIDPSDRRMWVWHSKMVRKSPEYYDAYYTWLRDRRSASYLLNWLLEYDTGDFNPSAPPPITDAKRMLIEASSPEVEQYLRSAVEECRWPMACDLISIPHLHSVIQGRVRSSIQMIAEALDNICGGDSVCLNRPRIGGSRIRLHAIRNQDRWIGADAEVLKKAYRMPIPPGMGETEGSYGDYIAIDLGTTERGPEF